MDDTAPLGPLLSGGYVLSLPFVPPVDRHETFFPEDVVTPPIISVSPCIADLLPDWWGDWSDDAESWRECEATWGVPRDRMDELRAWLSAKTAEQDILHAEVLTDLAVGRECAKTFLAERPDVRLLGIGLHEDSLAAYLSAVAQRPGCAPGEPVPPNACHELVRLRIPLRTGGKKLGYEVLNVAPYATRHTWFCHALERQMRDELGVRLGAGGLIESYGEACRVAEWCDSEKNGCEEGVWRAWQIVEYALDE